MSALFILIGISLLIAKGFLIAFISSVRNGQFEDDYTPSVRILFENTTTPVSENTLENNEQTANNNTSNL